MFKRDRIRMEAESRWYALTTETRTEYVNMIKRTAMELNDDYWGFEKDIEKGFIIEKKSSRSIYE